MRGSSLTHSSMGWETKHRQDLGLGDQRGRIAQMTLWAIGDSEWMIWCNGWGESCEDERGPLRMCHYQLIYTSSKARSWGGGGAIVGSWAVMDGDLRFWAEEFDQRISVDLWNIQLETIFRETIRIYSLPGTATVLCRHCVVSHASWRWWMDPCFWPGSVSSSHRIHSQTSNCINQNPLLAEHSLANSLYRYFYFARCLILSDWRESPD